MERDFRGQPGRLRGGHAEGQALPSERLAPGRGEDGALRAQAEVVERLTDSGGRRPVLLLLTVDGDDELAAVAHDDLLTVGDGAVDAGDDEVVRADGDALVLEHIADGAGEGVDIAGRAVDGQGDGLVEVGDTGHSGGEGADHTELGQAPNRKKVHGYSKFEGPIPQGAHRAQHDPRRCNLGIPARVIALSGTGADRTRIKLPMTLIEIG